MSQVLGCHDGWCKSSTRRVGQWSRDRFRRWLNDTGIRKGLQMALYYKRTTTLGPISFQSRILMRLPVVPKEVWKGVPTLSQKFRLRRSKDKTKRIKGLYNLIIFCVFVSTSLFLYPKDRFRRVKKRLTGTSQRIQKSFSKPTVHN